ncbi:hypothetical protein A2801_02625 [Candidatus Woesebacteria bacterium RIFCSPHIGHO2_01_FULL_41_10]|uniref:Urease accessory protein UreH-like transmembrane domain-containing protein n=1 Tax=Candidatus Woesebacteria bacterium RIFCSPHIGHO2_01_FULL_41_10 TaxID=1802500 RepID=A0A1F7YM38_9BACT|nr:MAG: hypothetical protein A2801_02625 [Candidatus Woesebacteria bacterium RIFCSPHIGHO2_01_FULL_41_10]
MDILTIFVTGLFAGGLTCLAVQGGLLATSIAQQEEEKLEEDAKIKGQFIPVFSFLGTRLLAYTVLGLLLGFFGSVAQLSLNARVFLQFAVAIFMIGTALNLLQVHPIFRYFVIQPPKALARLVRNQSKSKSVFGPALLGAFTVLIPCGATQAMMAYAISTGSPISGAVTMFAFILGTSPLFFLLGYAARKFGGTMSLRFNKIAAVAIILVAIYNISGAFALSGGSTVLGNVFAGKSEVEGESIEGVSEATIYFTRSGYTTDPKVLSVKGGSTLTLKLVNQNGVGCVQAFTIPKFGVQTVVPVGNSEEITLEIPDMSGSIAFMCSMGMYRGVINVI